MGGGGGERRRRGASPFSPPPRCPTPAITRMDHRLRCRRTNAAAGRAGRPATRLGVLRRVCACCLTHGSSRKSYGHAEGQQQPRASHGVRSVLAWGRGAAFRTRCWDAVATCSFFGRSWSMHGPPSACPDLVAAVARSAAVHTPAAQTAAGRPLPCADQGTALLHAALCVAPQYSAIIILLGRCGNAGPGALSRAPRGTLGTVRTAQLCGTLQRYTHQAPSKSAIAMRQRPLSASQLRGLPSALRSWRSWLAIADAPSAGKADLRWLSCRPAARCCSVRLPSWRSPAGIQQGRQSCCRVKVQQQAQTRCVPANEVAEPPGAACRRLTGGSASWLRAQQIALHQMLWHRRCIEVR